MQTTAAMHKVARDIDVCKDGEKSDDLDYTLKTTMAVAS